MLNSGPEAPPNRWYVLALLTAIFAVHYIDRGVMSVVVEPIKSEFALSDAAMGVLAGFAHSTALSVMVLPMGILADRSNRVKLVAAVVMLWSLMTALGSLAQGYTSLLLMRVSVGGAEAAGPPASVSLISDVFSRRELPTAMGIFYSAAAIGTGIVFLAGGYIAQHYGWRTVFLIAGIPGVLLSVLLFATVRDPVRQSAVERTMAPGVLAMGGELMRNVTLRWIMTAGTSAAISQAALWVWLASFMIRERGLSLTQAGIVVGVCGGVGMGIGSLLAGPLARRLSGDRAQSLWKLPGGMLVLSAPVGWAMVSAESVGVTIALALVLSVLVGSWAGQAVGILAAGVPSPMRGSAMSLYHLSTNLIGVGLGPLLTGAISDAAGDLGHAIAWTLSFNVVAAGCFFLAARSLTEEPATRGV